MRTGPQPAPPPPVGAERRPGLGDEGLPGSAPGVVLEPLRRRGLGLRLRVGCLGLWRRGLEGGRGGGRQRHAGAVRPRVGRGYGGAVGRGRPLHGRCGRPRAGAAVGRGAVLIGLVERLRGPRRGRRGSGVLGLRHQGPGRRGPGRCGLRCGALLRRVPGCLAHGGCLGRGHRVLDGRRLLRRRARAAPRRGPAPPLRLRLGGLPVVHALPATAVNRPLHAPTGRPSGKSCRNSTRFTDALRSPVRRPSSVTGRKRQAVLGGCRHGGGRGRAPGRVR